MSMNLETIFQNIAPAVADRGCFIVELSVSMYDDFVLTIESEEGSVTMDDCVAVSERFQEIFDKDVEDYSLTVTSAGLDQPFKVPKQYIKAIGSDVIVCMRGGRKLIGRLLSADETGITLAWKARETVDGKRKQVSHEEMLPFTEINSVTPYVDFK